VWWDFFLFLKAINPAFVKGEKPRGVDRLPQFIPHPAVTEKKKLNLFLYIPASILAPKACLMCH